MMLMAKNATITICHTRTVDPAAICREADIIISAAGVLNSLTKDYVRPGQVIIDVSMNWDAEKVTAKGKGGMSGDAVFEDVEPIVDAITPVPGGVGAVTTSVLMKHVVEAAEKTLRCCRQPLNGASADYKKPSCILQLGFCYCLCSMRWNLSTFAFVNPENTNTDKDSAHKKK